MRGVPYKTGEGEGAWVHAHALSHAHAFVERIVLWNVCVIYICRAEGAAAKRRPVVGIPNRHSERAMPPFEIARSEK